MRILYILKHDPWGIGGGCYACRNYLEAFTDIFNDAQFDILYCAEFKSIKEHEFKRWHFDPVMPMNVWSKLKSPITKIMDRFHARLLYLLNANKYDYCIFDHSSIAGSIVAQCKNKNVKTIVINHNFEYDYYRDSHPQWYKRMFVLPSIKRNEKFSYLNCNINIFLTQEDATLFKQIYGKSETKSIIGGCFEQKKEHGGFVKDHHESKHECKESGLKTVISGTLGNIQNMDGIDYFLNELYPLLPSDMEVIITGKNPPSSLIERIKGNIRVKQKTTIQDVYDAFHNNKYMVVSHDNVTLIANPSDIQSIVASCDIYLCPTKLGGGLKLRIMDGLRNGLPVICHQVSARGYHDFVENGFCIPYSNSEEFLSVLLSLRKEILNDNMRKSNVAHFFARTMGYEGRVRYLSEKLVQ